MGKLSSFEIYFDNPNRIFYSGSCVEGNVAIDLSGPLKMRGVHIKFKGKAEVEWTSDSNHDDDRRQTYTDKEKYFEKDILLFGNAPSEHYSAVELDTGHHDLPFRFQLPQGLPSSHESSKGSVSYKATAKIVRLDKEDHETTRPFTVVSVVDLNLKPEHRSPLSGSNQKHLCCCCCKSGPISADFYIERRGWVPGEGIRLYADIRNGSSRTIDKSCVDLFMKVVYRAQGTSTSETQRVARVTRPSIQGLCEDAWRGELLYVPSLPPTNLGGCKIIDVEYNLQLNVDPSGPSMDLEVPLQIVIGTIPLHVLDQPSDFMSSLPPHLTRAAGASAPPPYREPPPPSYGECIGGYGDATNGDERVHINGNRSFTPSYTFYNNWGDNPPPGHDVKKERIQD